MLRALILTSLLVLSAATAQAAVRGPNHLSGSATLSLTAASGVSGTLSMIRSPHHKAILSSVVATLPRK